MSILRNTVNNKFFIVQSHLVTLGISDSAFRVACYLLSRPDNWTVCNVDIMRQLRIKQQPTLAKLWRELLDAGVIHRKAKPKVGGRYQGFDYAIGDIPSDWVKSTDSGLTNNGETGYLNKTEITNNKIERRKRITGYFCQSTPDSPNEPPVSASSASSPASTSAPAPKSACSESKRVGMAAVAKAGYPVAAKALQILRTLQVFTESQIALTVKAEHLPIIEANLTALLDDNGATLGEYLERSVERATAKKWLNLSMVSGVGLVDAHGNQLSPDDFVCFANQIMTT